jgi:flagellar L-ring protein precursor FlgH
MDRRLARLLLAAVVVAGLVGCNSAPVRDPAYAPVRPVLPPPAPRGDGAIYHGGFGINWFEDLRALHVGDILTVHLNESTNASKTAKTTSTKTDTDTIDNPTLLGVQPKLPLPNSGSGSLAMATSSDHSFKGEGDSSQTNALTGDISVTVVEVLPNGYLSVRGEKRIGINQGNEYIRLSGIVRPYDVGSDNTVDSNKIADPTIVYVGDGAVGDSNVMGWLSRFFVSALLPF